MSRPVVVAGNWKMYKTIPEAVGFVKKLTSLWKESQVQSAKALLAVPFTAIYPTKEAVASLPLEIGGQNMHDAESGSFTGEIAAKMLLDAGATFVILGHSERRHFFGEDDAFIHSKVKKALEEGLKPILCIGETLEQREIGREHEVISEQLQACLKGVSSDQAADLLHIAYEPVWAIGTGKTATPQMVQEVHDSIREWLCRHFGKETGEKIPLLYGGSVKPDNLEGLVRLENVDGALVGGAALQPETFYAMLEIASSVSKEKERV